MRENRLDGMTSLSNFRSKRQIYQRHYPNLQNVLDQTVALDSKYDINIVMDVYIHKLMLQSLEADKYSLDIAWNRDRQYLDKLLHAYNELYHPFEDWVNFFEQANFLKTVIKNRSIFEILSVCAVITLFGIYGLWQLKKSMKFTNRTLSVLTQIGSSNFNEIKGQILAVQYRFAGLDLTAEYLAHQRSKERENILSGRQKKTKRRLEELTLPYFRRLIPIGITMMLFIGIAVTLFSIDQEFGKMMRDEVDNVLFFAAESQGTMKAVVHYKNFTLFERDNNYTSIPDMVDQIQANIQRVNNRYQVATQSIQAVFSSENRERLFNVIYGDLCVDGAPENCIQLFDGDFEKGLITGRIAMLDAMKKTVDYNSTRNELYQIFNELDDGDEVIKYSVRNILQVSIARVRRNVRNILAIIGVIMMLVSLFTLVTARIIWYYSYKKVREEFTMSRLLFTLIPVLYINKNNRVKHFLQTTSDVSFR